MVPQVYATWVNGLTPGRYYVRAWVFRYVQSALDGSTFQEYYFDVTPNEWAGDVTLPIDLRLSSWVNKTVYFHDTPNTITTDPIDTGAGVMSGVLVDANGNVWSYNQTLLGYNGLYTHRCQVWMGRRSLQHRHDPQKQERPRQGEAERSCGRDWPSRYPVLGMERYLGWRELWHTERHLHPTCLRAGLLGTRASRTGFRDT